MLTVWTSRTGILLCLSRFSDLKDIPVVDVFHDVNHSKVCVKLTKPDKIGVLAKWLYVPKARTRFRDPYMLLCRLGYIHYLELDTIILAPLSLFFFFHYWLEFLRRTLSVSVGVFGP